MDTLNFKTNEIIVTLPIEMTTPNTSYPEDPPPTKMDIREKSTIEQEKRRMLKNVIVVGIGFILLFTSFNSIANLQSSLHPEKGLGVVGMMTIYGALIISSLLIPTFAIRKLTSKWTIVFSMICYTFYMGAQFYPTFATIIPTAAILGFAGAPLWASKCFYLTQMAKKYAALVNDNNSEVVIVRFFGIFFCLFQTSTIWGNLISSLVLSSGSEASTNISSNVTNWNNFTYNQLDKCGADFCPGDLFSPEQNGEMPAELTRKVNIFCGICLGIAIFGIGITSIFLDSLERYGEKERLEGENSISGSQGTKQLLVATLRQMKNPYQLLLIPLTIFSGLQQSFFGADFTQAYITCSWGVHHVGYVFILYGIVDSVLSLSFGPVLRKTGRAPIFLFGAIIKLVCIAVFFFWKPSPETSYVFFVIAALWGAADAVWSCQINAFYGYIFPTSEEAAFSNYRLWEAVGFVIGYANSNLMCTRPKLYLLTTFLLIGITCFLIIEFIERRKLPKSDKNNEDKNHIKKTEL